MTEILHLLNRGVEGRDLFLDSSDYVRFIHNLYEFNDTSLAIESSRRDHTRANQDVGSRRPHIREKLVEIHGWCLMKNHYHLLVSEKVENGLSLFLRKINTGYANYFNAKYERKGALFQGKTKRVLIERQAQFLYILHYIHLNPLDYLEGAGKWRFRSKGTIPSAQRALQHLRTYRWSSLLDYLGEKNFPSLITTSLFKGAPGSYREELSDFLKGTESGAAVDSALTLE